MKNKFVKLGLLNLIITIPTFIIVTLWSWIVLAFCLGVLKMDNLSHLALNVALLPLLYAPISCVYGIIKGFRNRKQKGAIMCVVLSFIGFMIFWISLFGLAYIGSKY